MLSRLFKPLKRSCLFLTFLMAFYGLPAQSQNQEQAQNIFEFNISPNGYPPYLIVEDEEPGGILWDVVELIAPRLGYQVKARQVPRKRVDQMLSEGYIDATPLAIQWSREPDKFLFTDPIVHVEDALFFPQDSKLEFQRPEDLVGKTIVTRLGYVYPNLEPYFNEGRINRFDVSHDRKMFRFLLHSNRFDAALADRRVGQWILKTEGIAEHFRSSGKSVSRDGLRLMLRPEWATFARDFNRELAKMRENGELDAILARYR